MNLQPKSISLGQANFDQKLTEDHLILINQELKKSGFETARSNIDRLVVSAKLIIQSWTRENERFQNVNLSEVLSDQLKLSYSAVSKSFVKATGMSVEQYALRHRIELAKELLQYDEQSIKEISYELGYSHVSNFVNVFKREVGHTPGSYRKAQKIVRLKLDDI